MARPLALVAVCLAVVALIWFGWEGVTPAEPTQGEGPTADERDVATANTRRDAQPIALERDVVPTTVGATTGSLLITAIWASDKTPASGIAFQARRPGGEWLLGVFRGVTGDDGQLLFEELEPGPLKSHHRRGDDGLSQTVEIVAGQLAEATFEIKDGLVATGRVVDEHDASVAAADVIFCGWAGEPVLTGTRSREDGTFTLRGLPRICRIGARKAGFAPSPMQTLTTSHGAEVELTLVIEQGGGSLSGTVLGPDGQPVADAAVHVDRPYAGTPVQVVWTDPNGGFAFSSLPASLTPVDVRARGLAPWHEEVDVLANRPTHITVHLLRGATVLGNVTAATGEPLARVMIRLGGRSFGGQTVYTDENGDYRVEGVGVGSVEARAQNDQYGKVEEVLELVAGEHRRWDPVLSSELTLRGRVVDNAGRPLPRVAVEAQLDPSVRGISWHGMDGTDEEGRFALPQCRPGHPIKISVRRKSVFPEFTLRGVMPGPEEIEIKLPDEAWIHIEGTVLGPDDEVLSAVQALPFLAGGSGSPVETIDPKTGKFRFGPYPPGQYRLRLSHKGYPPIQLERTVQPDETWDTGTLRFVHGGSLRVHLIPASAEARVGRQQWTIYRDGKAIARFMISGETAGSGLLPPGDYELGVLGDAVWSHMVPFTILAGRDSVLDVPVAVGTPVSIRCELAPGSAPSGWVELSVADANGRLVHRRSVWRREGDYVDEFALRPGDYSLVATWEEQRAELPLSVGADPASTTLQLR